MIVISPIEDQPDHYPSNGFEKYSNVGRLYVYAIGTVVGHTLQTTKGQFWDVWVQCGDFAFYYKLLPDDQHDGRQDEIIIRMGDDEATIHRYGDDAQPGRYYTVSGSEELVTLAVMHLLT